MTTLGDMIDRIADELSRDDLRTQTADAIRSAVNHYGGEPWWFNEVAAYTITTTPLTELYPLPADFEHVENYNVIIGGNMIGIDQQAYDTISTWQTNNIFGQPTDFAIFQEKLDLYPIPNEAFVTVLSYIATVSTLTSTACTNAMMTYGEELIRSRARSDVRINFLRDEGDTSEYLALASTGEDFYSRRERSAYRSLRARSTRRVSDGKVRTTEF
ncbi:hypothetical protein UFOVP1244_36 [uncultured Caudovirales phage]|uniref:Uncharacterized protein n=1 Tax=uncultured Caudovirales phage TaxID=2100421 RepID=A0A6J5RL78_9CAUD|nr:hypothetical protein UFOVP1244_36 [uncultured Caudovirales phage]